MLGIEIPGFKRLFLANLVLDYNGTLACDGKVITGVGERLELLSDRLQVHVLTADTFGSAREELAKLPCRVSVISPENQAEAASIEAVLAAEILSRNILDALDLLLCPLRLTATLRA